MDRTHRRVIVSERAYYSSIVVMFFIAGALSFFYIRLELRQGQDELLRALGSKMRDLLVYHLTDQTGSGFPEDSQVLGFGIYDMSGSRVFTYLDAPDLLDTAAELDESIWNFDDGTVTYSEWTDALFRGDRLRESGTVHQNLIDSTSDYHILYIHSRLPRGFYQERVLRVVFVAVIIFILGIGIFFLRYSFIRNRLLRQELDSKESLIVLGTAARTLTHEMKNPLGVISLQTGLLRRKTDCFAATTSDEIDIIEEEVYRISSLMDDTRYYLGDDLGDPRRLDICSFSRRMKPRFNEKVCWLIPTAPIHVTIDEERFRSILENLVSNALDSGSDPQMVTVELRQSGGRASLVVSDKGSGMDRLVLARSRDPFFTTKTRGLGLGLHLVSRFTEASDGILNIETGKGEGTTITVTLPVTEK